MRSGRQIKLAEGIYYRGDQIHFDIPELLAAAGCEDTDENRTVVIEMALQAAVDAGWMKPDLPTIYVHRHQCPRCSVQWQHQGLPFECDEGRYLTCPRCNS